ncbi:hypothetical protein LINPERPRIM_LOCUS42831 [Linum perenne]
MAFSERGSLLPQERSSSTNRERRDTFVRVASLLKPSKGAASGLSSGRHSYVLLAPYLRIKKEPLDVVVTLWLRMLRGSGFMDAFSQRKSLKLNQYQQHVVTG